MVFLNQYLGFPCGLEVKNLPVNAGDMGSGRSPGGGKGNPLQYSCLGKKKKKKKCPFHHRVWNAKVGGQEIPGEAGNLVLELKIKQCKD